MTQRMENQAFIGFLLIISLMFLWVLKPFFGPIFWACAVTIVFAPLHQRLRSRFNHRRNLTALMTLSIVFTIVIVPVIFIASSVIAQSLSLYERLDTGELDLEEIVTRISMRFPFVRDVLIRFDVKLDDLQEQVTNLAVATGTFLAERSLNIGQNAFQFVLNVMIMIYLTFFMLRDGPRILSSVKQALPLGSGRKRLLLDKFSDVTRAIVKGNIVIAAIQGALGGVIFWILGIPGAVLWGVVMAVVSLIPVIGAALIWAPVAIYLFAVAEYLDGIILTVFGVFVIGLADNILRPILVGRNPRLPDYLVLLTTLGGIALVGIHGFVVGPLVAALFLTFWGIFIREFESARG